MGSPLRSRISRLPGRPVAESWFGPRFSLTFLQLEGCVRVEGEEINGKWLSFLLGRCSEGMRAQVGDKSIWY